MYFERIDYKPEVQELLASAGLPTSDLAEQAGLCLFGLVVTQKLIGVVGVEVYEKVGLIRSLAVAPAQRKRGYGQALVAHGEAWAWQQGVKTLYLLTTTASAFLAKLGYEVVKRAEAPSSIAQTTQFADLCPASSTFMRKNLRSNDLKP